MNIAPDIRVDRVIRLADAIPVTAFDIGPELREILDDPEALEALGLPVECLMQRWSHNLILGHLIDTNRLGWLMQASSPSGACRSWRSAWFYGGSYMAVLGKAKRWAREIAEMEIPA
jgi:hypothetical protein